MPRYKNSRKFANTLEFYEFLRAERGDMRSITQYATVKMRNPTVAARTGVASVAHLWKYGDKFYNLAQQYYGAPAYWWVIAWWNGRPTEAHCHPGDALMIPLDLEQALKALGTD